MRSDSAASSSDPSSGSVRSTKLNGTVSCVQRPRKHPLRPTVVCFVRHATTPTTGKVLPGRARGLHISEEGREQAAAAAARFDGMDVAAVYSSPLERARETAAPIADVTGREVVLERGLVECDFGEWTGAELSKLRRQPEWNTVQRWPSGWRFPGGESFLDLQQRLQETVLRFSREHPGQLVVAVSHADCIKAVLALALGMPLDSFQRIAVGPCSASAIVLGDEAPGVLAVNSYGVIAGLPQKQGAGAVPRSGTERPHRRVRNVERASA